MVSAPACSPSVLALLLVYTPLALVVLNSFNTDESFGWPPSGLTLEWWSAAAHPDGARAALQRHRFFGRNAVSLLIILPIALPGIVTGIALNNAFRTVFGLELGFLTIVVAHATFCIVTVFNNVQARLRRLGGTSRRPRWTSAPGPSPPSGW